MNRTNPVSPQATKTGRLLCLLIPALLASGHTAHAAGPQAGGNQAGPNHVHGIGKQAFDCDFSVVSVTVQGQEPVDRRLDGLITFDVEDHTHHSARRFRQRVEKVYPVSLMFDEHAGTRQIVIESCDGKDSRQINSDEARDDPRRYLLTYNRTNRPRLVEFSAPEGMRPRYHTVVRNVASIRLLR